MKIRICFGVGIFLIKTMQEYYIETEMQTNSALLLKRMLNFSYNNRDKKKKKN